MIYIKNLDTVFIRPPKTGSTTLALYVADSGLLNKKHDFRDWELGQAMWMPDGSVDMSNYHNTPDVYPETNYSFTTEAEEAAIIETLRKNLRKKELARRAASGNSIPLLHGFYDSGVDAGKYTTSAKCVATVRHPIDRFMSIVHGRNLFKPQYHSFNPAKEDLNTYIAERLDWESTMTLRIFSDQHKYYNDAPTLWNTENIHDHATAYFATNGGVIRQRWHARRNERRPAGIADQLTNEIKQKILTRYEKDFLLWEKAYAVYN